MRHSSRKTDASLRIAVIFFVCIGLLILGGVLLKLFLVLNASSFDGMHQYVLEVDESSQKGEIVAFNPDKKTIVTLFVNGKAPNGFAKTVGIPIDASVHMHTNADAAKLTQSLLFGSTKEKGLTIIDKIRLLLFANTVKANDFTSQTVSLPVDVAVSEKLLPSLFVDNTIYTDNESVSIVNATGESGVGSEVAHMLTTIGVNVVSVTTADTNQNTTTLSGTQVGTYTAKRLAHLFQAQMQTHPGSIADLTLTIGKKSISLVE